MEFTQLSLDFPEPGQTRVMNAASLMRELARFQEFGKKTIRRKTQVPELGVSVDTFVNEFWTSKQRDAHSLHEISYRACFKPQLPRFFIARLTRVGDVVYDPFMGRGTTLLEAALMGRIPCGCDVNPLSATLIRPRLTPPTLEGVSRRLSQIDLTGLASCPEDLLAFYHPETLREVGCLRRYLMDRDRAGELDGIDQWIRMVAVNRLTGHSAGFFSVYTMPPNQAVSVKSQRKINERRNQTPPRRLVKEIILRKSRSLLKDCAASSYQVLRYPPEKALLLTGPSDHTPKIASDSVSLAVTSPPFLDVVNYEQDNWLRCWFLGIDPQSVRITMEKSVEGWKGVMTAVFREARRVLRAGGHLAFEVGEVRGGAVRLEEAVLPCGREAGLEPLLILINDQAFTKTAQCWGVDNNSKGTNTNRVVLFRKPS
jgi:hypothetical protein